jgi:hypothetical protein
MPNLRELYLADNMNCLMNLAQASEEEAYAKASGIVNYIFDFSSLSPGITRFD